MDFDQLLHFKRVSELEHITRAADELYISQSTLSLSIKRLEEEFGVKFLEKKGRNIVVNDYGRILLKYTIPMLEQYEKLKQEISDLRDIEYNSITISSPTLFRFPGLVDEILEKYPSLTISYKEFPKDDLQGALENGEVDFIISNYTFSGAVKSTLLCESPAGILVSKNHPLAKLENPTIDDFNKYTFVVYVDDHPVRPWVDYLLDKNGFTSKRFGISKGLKDSISAVRTGKYVTFVPESILSNILGFKDSFVYFPLKDPDSTWRHILSTTDQPDKRQIVKDIEKIIKDYFEIEE